MRRWTCIRRSTSGCNRLAPDQRAAATAPPGPVLCVAPAGSGKTTTLVARICWLVATGADPGRVTAVTFNKRAADELGERLANALEPLGVVEPAVRVRTFHALGREILADAGVSVRNLVDRSEALTAINGRPLSGSQLRRLDDGFSRLKLDLGIDVVRARTMLASRRRAIPLPADVIGRFIHYEEWLAEHDALDFDDLVRRALAALQADAGPRWIGGANVARRCSSTRCRTSTGASSSWPCCCAASGATSSWSATTIRRSTRGGWPTCAACSTWPVACPVCAGSTWSPTTAVRGPSSSVPSG